MPVATTNVPVLMPHTGAVANIIMIIIIDSVVLFQFG
jgi:hypothetical protein